MRVVAVPEPAAFDSPRWGFCDAVSPLRGLDEPCCAVRAVACRVPDLPARGRPRPARRSAGPLWERHEVTVGPGQVGLQTFASDTSAAVPIHPSRGAFPGQGGPSDVGPYRRQAGRATSPRSLWPGESPALRDGRAPVGLGTLRADTARWAPSVRTALVACGRGPSIRDAPRARRAPRRAGLGERHHPRGHHRRRSPGAAGGGRPALPGPRGGRRPPRSRPSWSTGPASAGSAPHFDRDRYTGAVTDALVGRRIDVVVMAGFGTVLGQPIHDAFPGRILNTHPALLPAFPGWHAVDDALAAGVAETGTTVHIATLEMDAGPVLAQATVPGPPRRHRGDPARADQIGRADPLPRHHPPLHRRAGGDGRAMGQDHRRRLRHEGTAVCLRQDRDRRPGPRAVRAGLGAGLERRHLGGPGRGRHRPHRGGRPDRRPRDARRPGQDPPPHHPRRHPGRPVQARAPGRPRAPGHRPDRPGGLQPLPVLVRSRRSS